MVSRRVLLASALAIAFTAYAAYYISYYPTAALVLGVATLAFGVLSSLIAARRLYFLAGASPHAALLAAIASTLLHGYTGVPLEYTAMLLSILLVYLVGYPIFRGFNPDMVTALFVSLVSSLSVILVNIVARVAPLAYTYTASTLVFGDPLLATRRDVPLIILVSLATVAASIATYREQVLIGLNREQAVLTGIRVWVYDLVFFTILGASLAVLLPVVGFILMHVLLLLPGVIALYAPSSRAALSYSLLSALLAGGLGLWLSILLDVSPSGSTGLVLFAAYLAVTVYSRRG